MISKKGLSLAGLIVLVIIGIFFVWFVFALIQSPLGIAREVVINEGQGVSAIAGVLKREKVIESELAFIVYTVVTGNEKKLQAGRYVFGPGTTIPAVVNALVNGIAESDDIVVTIPEGFNVFDIDNRLTLLGLTKAGEFAGRYYADEGWLFPDTYRLESQKSKVKSQNLEVKNQNGNVKIENKPEIVNELAEKMKNNFKNKTDELLGKLNIEEQNKILIIASLLEKEAKNEEDMRLIAGILEKRLALGMMLQIDAAVAYGACLRNFQFSIPNFQTAKYCDVSQVSVGAEIKIDGPYNTYTRVGLPPGPIANPGLKAIRAALDPLKSEYLYYLSTRDGSQVIFSKTASEHAANRRKYLGL